MFMLNHTLGELLGGVADSALGALPGAIATAALCAATISFLLCRRLKCRRSSLRGSNARLAVQPP